MTYGLTKLSAENLITIFGMYRNQAIFALFLLEEAYQCLNIITNLCFMRKEFQKSYQLATYGISDCVNLANLCKNPLVSALIYPTNLGYLSFFRAEIIAFVEIRNRILVSGVGDFTMIINGVPLITANDNDYLMQDDIMNRFMYERDNGTFERRLFSDMGVFTSGEGWGDHEYWKNKIDEEWHNDNLDQT
ncbi:hypothetical protein [Bacteroides sp.]|uniref:hypothetical protein n=1 Tax=Bacteroides sp. TaxID=29523 RepID=UPI002639D250|nr:hypothetical protein [Bacteroides sp.]MDD3039005.1 hypothetical protein [Bacteroides sp.]